MHSFKSINSAVIMNIVFDHGIFMNFKCVEIIPNFDWNCVIANMFIFTVTTDCSIDEHHCFERMSVVEAWALQMKTITFKPLGAKMNIECIKYLQKTV